MPLVRDFRTISKFNIDTVSVSGRYIGKKVYWKFYAIENFYRIILHSILSLQLLPPDWWVQAVDVKIQKKSNYRRHDYLVNPWHTMPGQHSVYFIDIGDLNEIARVNSDKLRVVIPDIDNFIARIETIRLPRNVVAHMSFLSTIDRSRVDIIYEDFKALIKLVQKTIVLQVPK